jgi:hypothetical protein
MDRVVFGAWLLLACCWHAFYTHTHAHTHALTVWSSIYPIAGGISGGLQWDLVLGMEREGSDNMICFAWAFVCFYRLQSHDDDCMTPVGSRAVRVFVVCEDDAGSV